MKPTLLPFTVVGVDLDHLEPIIEHLYAKDGRAAMRAFLVNRADCRQAIAVFPGHLKEAK